VTPRRVTIENFLCFGDRAEIEFTDDEPLWVLGGPNGVGKSAVFDAMTYCLYGQHRGGGRDVGPLVRHGADGFHVGFEFSVGDKLYRVNRGRTGRPYQSAEEHVGPGDRWRSVPNVISGPQVNAWAAETVGLSFDAFTASVLLRQNEADKVVTGTGVERLNILKRVVGVERYEHLSTRVRSATTDVKNRLESARRDLNAAPAVTDDDLEAGRTAATAAEAVRVAASEAATVARGAIDQSKQWAKLRTERADLTARLDAAETRAINAERLRADAARRDELDRLLPALRPLPAKRDTATRLAAALDATTIERDREADRAKALADEVTAARGVVDRHARTVAEVMARGKELKAAITQRERYLKLARETEASAATLAAFPAELDAELTRLKQEAADAATADREAGGRRSSARTLFEQAEKAVEKFAGVAGGVECSECGQLVTAEHAERERQRLAAALGERRVARDVAHRDAAAATERKVAADARLAEVVKQVVSRDQARASVEQSRRSLADLDCTQTAAELAAALAADTEAREAALHEHSRATAELAAAEGRVTKLKADADAAEKSARDAAKRYEAESGQHARASADLDATLARLDARWHAATAGEVATLDGEFRALDGEALTRDLKQLGDDEALRPEWQRQLSACDLAADAIPLAARVGAAEAERASKAAVATLSAAESAWQSARDELSRLAARHARFGHLAACVKALELDHARHAKLDALLGKEGLQRHLVRAAERAIVRLADETVGRLSAGDLSLSLAAGDDTDREEKAFTLAVRRAGGADAIGVDYLSGSQKFRVAVAMALAIGRYKTNQSRHLESVIIDEGFGSLDRDGLRAAAEELNGLRGLLKRVVIVSHQEEFTDQFPVVIRLSAGPNGTVATKVRR
jgi:exonuclease SbcC